MHALSFDDRIFFTASIFLLVVFYKYIELTIFLLHAIVFVCEPSLMKLFVKMHVWSDDR
jgi:hypothetical protein